MTSDLNMLPEWFLHAALQVYQCSMINNEINHETQESVFCFVLFCFVSVFWDHWFHNSLNTRIEIHQLDRTVGKNAVIAAADITLCDVGTLRSLAA